MSIRHILVFWNCLYDLPGPKFKNLETLEKGAAQNALIALSTKMKVKYFKHYLER